MKFRSFILSAAAAVMAFAACENEAQNLGSPDIAISTTEMTFESESDSQELTVRATRDWWIETEADWVIVDPESGSASADEQKVTVTVLDNDGLDREASIRFTVSMKSKYLKVTQSGPEGSAADRVVYSNDFQISKTTEKPYLDESLSIWDNKKGSGIELVEYAVGGKMSVRTTGKLSNDEGDFSHYAGSGGNKVFFGAATSVFKIQNITLPSSESIYKLSFGGQKYGQEEPDNTFSFEEFKVYLSKDSQTWVPLTMSYAEGADLVGDWNQFFASFTVPAGTSTLGIAFVCSASSLYSLDDVLLEIGTEAGQTIDFANGIEISGTTVIDGSGNGSGGGSGEVGDLPEGTGEGTLANPYDAAKATKVTSELPSDGTKSGVYVKGTIKSIKEVSTQYGNASYYITDADGAANFYVFRGKYLDNASFTSEGQIKVGDEVVVYGDLLNYMGNTPELAQGNYIVKLNGEGSGEFVVPESKGTKTVAEFLEAADTENYYTLSGTVSAFGSTHCDFNLEDTSGSVYVYSVLPQSKSTWASKITDGGTITIYGKYKYYDGGGDATKAKHEVVDAYIVSYTPGEGGEVVTPPAGEAGEFDSEISWTLGSASYDNTSTGNSAQKATVNGVTVSNLLKFGKGSDASKATAGAATLHVPAGTAKIGFYAVGWKNTTVPVKFSVGGTEIATISAKPNNGASGNPSYTMTVTDADYYEVDIPSSEAVDVKVETYDTAGLNHRAILFAIKPLTE